jgi:hypothetical protein
MRNGNGDQTVKSGVARIAIAVVGALTFSACLLGVDPPAEADAETKAKYPDVVSATVGGVPWSVKVNDTWFAVLGVGTFTIGGRNAANSLKFYVNGVNRLGTYPIGGGAWPNAIVELTQDGVLYAQVTSASIGSFTVTELTTTRFAGTFTFTVPRYTPITPGGMTNERTSMPVTNGTFSVAVYPAYSIPIAR